MLNPFTIYRNYKIFKRLVEMLEAKVDTLEKDRELQIYQHARDQTYYQEKYDEFNRFLKMYPLHMMEPRVTADRNVFGEPLEIHELGIKRSYSIQEIAPSPVDTFYQFKVHNELLRHPDKERLEHMVRWSTMDGYKELIARLLFKEEPKKKL